MVVYRPFPTSNHNQIALLAEQITLYIVRFLHQTTTDILSFISERKLYIVRFLHQTTTDTCEHFERGKLYIVRFLHQTTTCWMW